MRWLLAVTILLPLVIAACSSSDPADQERANVDVVRRLYTEVWSTGDVSVLDEIIGDGYVKHWAAYPPTVGRDELKTHVTRSAIAFRTGTRGSTPSMPPVTWSSSAGLRAEPSWRIS